MFLYLRINTKILFILTFEGVFGKGKNLSFSEIDKLCFSYLVYLFKNNVPSKQRFFSEIFLAKFFTKHSHVGRWKSNFRELN